MVLHSKDAFKDFSPFLDLGSGFLLIQYSYRIYPMHAETCKPSTGAEVGLIKPVNNPTSLKLGHLNTKSVGKDGVEPWLKF